MSAIGSYEVLNRGQFPVCVGLARNVRTETTGKWIFRKTRIFGMKEFEQAWRASLVQTVDFEYSGYVLGNYLDAQLAINSTRLIDEHSETARLLSMVFTAGFVFEEPLPLPTLAEQKLHDFCQTEYGKDAPGMIEAITAAHSFYTRGLREITSVNLVVFVIR